MLWRLISDRFHDVSHLITGQTFSPSVNKGSSQSSNIQTFTEVTLWLVWRELQSLLGLRSCSQIYEIHARHRSNTVGRLLRVNKHRQGVALTNRCVVWMWTRGATKRLLSFLFVYTVYKHRCQPFFFVLITICGQYQSVDVLCTMRKSLSVIFCSAWFVFPQRWWKVAVELPDKQVTFSLIGITLKCKFEKF